MEKSNNKLGINDLANQFGETIMDPEVERNWAEVQRGIRNQQQGMAQMSAQVSDKVTMTPSQIAEMNGFTPSHTDKLLDEQFSTPQHG